MPRNSNPQQPADRGGAEQNRDFLGGPSKDGRFYGMSIYMDPTEQRVSHRKRPPHTIPNSSIQSSQHVVQLQQIVTKLQENQLTLQEKVDRMERMFFMMQVGGGIATGGGA
ncbi:hypothetical protein SLEP1_g31381 [Rubroshorea leprosula]|uniref:Uncharacterized protein n=1 Tax=Rubroshorea leprosula TaxID=152421 RepID=A0AAV5K372_9ROSI|nr:hypothetical protein SLEP1_g31381 [Rubroshorea leprosula]